MDIHPNGLSALLERGIQLLRKGRAVGLGVTYEEVPRFASLKRSGAV